MATTLVDPPRAFHLLAKPTGAVCNLDCSYCFFLSKEMLYPGSRFRMADDLLETYIRQLIEAHAGAPEVTIAWQGGEPTLMGVEFFRRSVELANGILRPGQRAEYTIQTNAHAARRRVGGVLQGERLPRRGLDRRAEGAARRLPREQGRQGLVRPGDAGLGHLAGGGRRVERADDGPRTPTPSTAATCTASSATNAARGSSSSSRSSSGSRRRTRTEPCPGRRGATGRCTSRTESASPAARSPPSSTGAS